MPSTNQQIASIQPMKSKTVSSSKVFPMHNEMLNNISHNKIKTEIVKPMIRSIECENCSATFFSQASVSDHQKSCQQNLFYCSKCNISFKLKVILNNKIIKIVLLF